MRQLASYLEEARAIIVKWGSYSLLSDDDVIADVATELMRAEATHDPSKGASLTTWRISLGRYALLNYFRKKKRHSKKRSIESLTSEEQRIHLTYKNEERILNKILVEEILSSRRLSDKQRVYIKEFFLMKMNLQQIADKHKISKQAVHKCMGRGLETLKIAFRKGKNVNKKYM